MARWLVRSHERATDEIDKIPDESLDPTLREALLEELEAAHETPGICPENAAAFELYLSCQTQWRMGPRSLIGLDYTAVEAVMRMQRIPPAQRPDLFWRLRVIEATVLENWAAPRTTSE